jgi:DNA-binding transcriptional ArsR family regulator
MSRWWRAYDEAVDDPKLQCLSDECFRFWFNLCCVCSINKGDLPPLVHIAFQMRMQERKVVRLLNELRAAGLIDEDNQGSRPHNWHGRQYKSDVSTERVRRLRKQRRNVSSTVSETPPETETESETEKNKKERSLRSRPSTRKNAVSIPDGWQPNRDFATQHGLSEQRVDQEVARFRDHALTKGRTAKNWDAAWRNWITSPYQQQKGASNGARPVSLATASDDLVARAEEFDRAHGVGVEDDDDRGGSRR